MFLFGLTREETGFLTGTVASSRLSFRKFKWIKRGTQLTPEIFFFNHGDNALRKLRQILIEKWSRRIFHVWTPEFPLENLDGKKGRLVNAARGKPAQQRCRTGFKHAFYKCNIFIPQKILKINTYWICNYVSMFKIKNHNNTIIKVSKNKLFFNNWF